MKTCTKCKQTKSKSEFHKRARNKDGLLEKCKQCKAADDKVYRDKNLQKIADKKREWREANVEHQVAKKAEDYRNNTDAYKERAKRSAAARVPELQMYRKEYYRRNKARCDAHAAAYGRRRRAKQADLQENFTVNDELLVRESFNEQCFVCGSTYVLSIDHHVPLSFGAPLTRANAVLLCRSCNSRKASKLPQQFYTLEQLAELAEIFKRNDKCQEKKT